MHLIDLYCKSLVVIFPESKLLSLEELCPSAEGLHKPKVPHSSPQLQKKHESVVRKNCVFKWWSDNEILPYCSLANNFNTGFQFQLKSPFGTISLHIPLFTITMDAALLFSCEEMNRTNIN